MITEGTAYNYPLIVRSNISDATKLLQIAPIPPFLIYDGSEKDLDAAEPLERVLAMDIDGGGQDKTLNLQNLSFPASQYTMLTITSHMSTVKS